MIKKLIRFRRLPIRSSFLLALVLVFYPILFAADGSKPNVIIIYGDDVGYGDLGVYGSKQIPTPNLDRLAKDGLLFTDAHCTSATCSPSRYAMLTGRHAFRRKIGIMSGKAKLSIPTDILTLPKVFKKAGYRTAVIGKWHLGLGEGNLDYNKKIKPGPLEVGFDYSFIIPATGDRVPCVYVENHHVLNLDPKDPIVFEKDVDGSTTYPNGIDNPEKMILYKGDKQHAKTIINGVSRIGYMSGGKAALWNDEGMADELVKRSLKFILDNKDRPFFLFFSAHDIHVPRIPHPRFRGKSQHKFRGDAMVQLDWCAGAIMKSLESHGLTRNTIVIFTSDNGPVYDDGYSDGTTVRKAGADNDQGHYAAGPFRGGKYSYYEGGTRIPTIIRWPARIKPGKSAALVTQIDFIASFSKLLGVKISKDDAPDSKETLAAFLGEDKKGNEYIIEQAGGIAIRHGSWKYIKGRASKKRKSAAQLYNVKTDIGEKNNILENNKKVAMDLANKLEHFINSGRMRD